MSPRKDSKGGSSPQELIPTEDLTGDNPALAADNYNAVAKRAKLAGIVLTCSNFKLSKGLMAERTAGHAKRNITYGASIHNVLFDPDGGIVACDWEWRVTELVKGKKAVALSTTYSIMYYDLKGCDAAAVERFIRRVGRFATYPYFRAHVSQLSWESGAQLPIMPVIST